jgi:AraC-like DNA-binding protein
MPGGGTSQFSDPEFYVASLRTIAAEIVSTGSGRFDARLTEAQLPHIDLLRAAEAQPRIAYVSLHPPALSATFLTHRGPPVLLNGVKMELGEIALHASGECFHQRTTGATRWGLLAIAPQFASTYAAALAGRPFHVPSGPQIIRAPPAALAQFLHLHARVGHLIETHPAYIDHPEVARALEQELIHGLMKCLCGSKARSESVHTRRHAEILARFEYELAMHPDRCMPMPELCAIIGISERTLSLCCATFLGMSPSQYVRRRRLNLVHREILNADPSTAKVGVIAQKYSFRQLGRFAASYRDAFGEMPSITLRRIRNERVGDARQQ